MRITFTGDILCYQSQDRLCRKSDGSYDYYPIFENVKHVFQKSDYVVGSFETTCAGKKAGYTNADSSFNTPDDFLRALKKVGFSMLTTANNHCLDRGEAGLLRTIQKIRENGLEHTGTRTSPKEPKYLIKDIDGTRVAFLAYTYGTNSKSNGNMIPKGKEFLVNLTRPQDEPHQRPLWKKIVLSITPKSFFSKRKYSIVEDCVSDSEVTSSRNCKHENAMLDTIREAKSKSDIVIMCLHSGGQFNNKIGAYTQHLFDIIAKAGADAIICNHAHRILPVFKKDRCLVASALGNFSFVPGEGYWVDNVGAEYSNVIHLEITDKQIINYHTIKCQAYINENGIGATKIALIDGDQIKEIKHNE